MKGTVQVAWSHILESRFMSFVAEYVLDVWYPYIYTAKGFFFEEDF